ncbi:TetR family transcriptional regulator [Stackebrandtia albiflava]|uniref:TetR family transcriptional regulator n=1 Tax=Stackebrandtia albiflava TaxID=406432 RepID=A0A562V176_9ACTN|nr:TetR/AcrR family transcriptional regulator [Stackebrandtia albiflava]TWJ11676.1 TetR family transcriptional regulator [Stackebrandtia albiflava]
MQTEKSATGRPEGSFIERARRAQITAAAIEVVAESGYAGASLARIAAHAGISKSVISYHFAGKDELLTEVVNQVFHDTWRHAEPLLAAQPDQAGRLRVWIEAQLSYMSENRDRLLALGAIMTNHLGADGGARYADEIRSGVTFVADLIRDGQRAGEFRDCDPVVAATTVNQAVQGALNAWVLDPGIDITAYSRALVDLFDHALRVRPGGEEDA